MKRRLSFRRKEPNMLKLRPFENADADIVAGWVTDERTLRRWSGRTYPAFPVTGAEILARYAPKEGEEPFRPVTAVDENGPVGHLAFAYTDAAHKTVRLFFVIVDDARRGEGLGGELIRLALDHAFGVLGAERVTLGVFDTNPRAWRCYQREGFRFVPREERRTAEVLGETWEALEMEIER